MDQTDNPTPADDNPYLPPEIGASSERDSSDTTGIDPLRVRRIGLLQKGILLVILCSIFAVGAFSMLARGMREIPPGLVTALEAVLLGLRLAGLICVVLLAPQVSGLVGGVVYGLLYSLGLFLGMYPRIGLAGTLLALFVLLVVSSRATRILRGSGLRVGLLGVALRDLPRPGKAVAPLSERAAASTEPGS